MLYFPIRKNLRNIIISRNAEETFKILISNNNFKEKLLDIKRIIYPEIIRNKYDNLIYQDLFDIEKKFYNASYETIMGLNVLAQNSGVDYNNIVDLVILDEDEEFPHNLILKLEKIAKKEGMGIASQQKIEFEVTKEIITAKDYKSFFERHTEPIKNDYKSEMTKSLYNLHNIMLQARRILLKEYIDKIY